MAVKRIINIQGRIIGRRYEPFVIEEIGINHEEVFKKQKKWWMMQEKAEQNA